MKISGRFVEITDTKFVPDHLEIFSGEAITFKLKLAVGDNPNIEVFQVLCLLFVNERHLHCYFC